MEPGSEFPELLETETLPSRVDPPAPGFALDTSKRDLDLVAGRTFGGYRPIRCLGRGGFAEVWEAERLLDGRILALKVLRGASGLSDSAQRRFEREGRLAGSLSHPHTVYVFAAEIVEGRRAIAMEIVYGGSLQDRIEREGPLPPHQAVDSILDVIDGLEAAQSLGIIHRDVKPSNCFVNDAGRVKIGDFGISRSLDSDSGVTTSGVFLGTLAYASPEQIRGLPLDHRSDLYSIGATLYALLAGRHPFDGKRADEVVAGVLTGRPAPLSAGGAKVPRPLERIVLRLLSKDPSRRYPSYDELRSALLPFSTRDRLASDPVRRFAAYLVDVVLWNAIALLILFGLYGRDTLEWIQQPTRTMSLVATGLFAARVLVFTIVEYAWQRTPGKYLFQLATRNVDGSLISPRQALLRNLSFWTMHDALGWAAAFVPSWLPVLSLMGAALPCLSMRKDNGYAGLHEVLSKTRVRAVGDARRHAGPAEAPVPSAAPSSGVDGAELRGPYRVVRELWRTEDSSLSLASDDLLSRQVWIHECSGSSPPAGRSNVPHRAARLRWLQGGSHDGRVWNAYEAPSGSSLVQLVRARGRLEWAEARRVMLQLGREIEAGLGADDLPASVDLSYLWIDSFGQLKVLEFPAVVGARDTRCRGAEDGGWAELLRSTARLVLEGMDGGDVSHEPRAPRAPVPVSARAALTRLFTAPLDAATLERLVSDLRELCARPASISRLVRTSHLLFAWSLPAVFAIGAFFGTIESLQRRAPSTDTLGTMVLNVAAGLDSALVVLGLVSVFALLVAFAFRGGPILRCFGTIVRERDGAPASRGHCLLRSAIALLPPLIVGVPVWFIVLLVISGGGSTHATPPPDASVLNEALWRVGSTFAAQARTLPGGLRIAAVLAGSVLALVFLAGTVAAIVRPQAGIHDRIVGTRIMPR